MSRAMTSSFCVAPGKHHAFQGSDYKGVVSARVGDEVRDVSCGFWPVPFEFVVPGLEFTATLQGSTHPQYGLQYQARGIKVVDERFMLKVDAIKNKVTPALFTRLASLARRFGIDVFDKLRGVYDGTVAPETLVGGQPKATIAHVRDLALAYDETSNVVLVSDEFPPIDAHMAIKYKDIVGVDDIHKDPYVLYWRKPEGRLDSNPLHVADEIAKSHLATPCEMLDERRVGAYFNAAIKRLQREGPMASRGSIWYSREAISKTMVDLLANRGDDWAFSVATLAPIFDGPASFVSEDAGMYARKRDDLVERSLARHLLKRPTHHARQRAMECIRLFDALVGSADSGATEASLDRSYTGWRNVFDAYAKSDDVQRSALHTLVEKGVLILMGGAGTGKSTTLTMIVRFVNLILGVDMKACALTGKAVDRLKTIFGDTKMGEEEIECRTLHSMSAKVRNEPIGALAIDEASMAYPAIVEQILSPCDVSYLVICGDDKQLPSIDPGAFLRDVVASGLFPTVRLERIYRTGQGSGIATEAPKIFEEGDAQLPVAPMDVGGFEIVLKADLDAAIARCGRFAQVYGKQAMVMISNTRQTCKDANRELQPLCNPRANDPLAPRLARKHDHAPWIVGDRVISLENIDLDNGDRIFNGMNGEVIDVNLEKKTVTVQFRDIVHVFKSYDTSIDHAYCVTTWKYQGSEIPAAVVFFDATWGLSCELIYTAVTRGQQAAAMFVSETDLKTALGVRIGSYRQTRLTRRLVEAHRAQKKREREADDDEDDE